jgi:hypothetical protein
MAGIPGDYEVDSRGHVRHGAALTAFTGLDANASDLALFAGGAPTPQRLEGLHRRVRIGGVLVCANLYNSRHPWAPECGQHWLPGSGAEPA